MPVSDGAELHLTPFPTLELTGGSGLAERARAALARAARSGDPVLIVAEPGLNAAAVARAVHDAGVRAASPFVQIDCTQPDAAVLEQQLLAGAPAGGTLSLGSVQELPAPLQSRLARAMRDGQIELDGAGHVVPFDARVIAMVAGSLDDAIGQDALRRELVTRFAQRVELPPLRLRPADIPTLVGCLVADAAASVRVPVPSFSREALTLLSALPWRRNLDELREVLEVLVRAAVGGTVRLEDVLDHVPLEPVTWSRGDTTSLREARLSFERRFISTVLSRHRGRMEDAARSLGIQRTNLYRKVRQLGIGIPRTKTV